MIRDESGFDDVKAASATVPSMRKARFLEYISGVLGAFLHPVPALVENRGMAPDAIAAPNLPGNGLASAEESSGPGRQASMRREPGLLNRSRAPRVYRSGQTRMIGFAIIGGSLENRLSHRPAPGGGVPGGKKP